MRRGTHAFCFAPYVPPISDQQLRTMADDEVDPLLPHQKSSAAAARNFPTFTFHKNFSLL
jgi:hypothetical protein